MKFALLSLFFSALIAAQSCQVEVVQGTDPFASFSGLGDEANMIGDVSLAVGPSGDLYVAAQQQHQILRFLTDGHVVTVAGNATIGTTGDGGPATLATLDTPESITVDTTGRLYFIDGRSRVRRINLDGTIETVFGIGIRGFNGDVAAPTRLAGGPIGLADAPDGSIYIADAAANRIRRLLPDGTIQTVAGALRAATRPLDPLGLRFKATPGIAVDKEGRLYFQGVVDQVNHVFQLTPGQKPEDAQIVDWTFSIAPRFRIAKAANHQILFIGLPFTPFTNVGLQLLQPNGSLIRTPFGGIDKTTMDTQGNVVLPSATGVTTTIASCSYDDPNRCQRYGKFYMPNNVDRGPTRDGLVSTSFGIGSVEYGGLASDQNGRLLIAQRFPLIGSGRVWALSPGGLMQVVAGSGGPLDLVYLPEDFDAPDLALSYPADVDFDLDGRVYVNDIRANGTMYRILPNKKVEVVNRLDRKNYFHSSFQALRVARDGTVYAFDNRDDPSGYTWTGTDGQPYRATLPFPGNSILSTPNRTVYASTALWYQEHPEGAQVSLLNKGVASPPISLPVVPLAFTSESSGYGRHGTDLYRFSLNAPPLRLIDPRLGRAGVVTSTVINGTEQLFANAYPRFHAATVTPAGDLYLGGKQIQLLHRPQDCTLQPPVTLPANALVNAASFGYKNKVSPGSLVTLFGGGLTDPPVVAGVLTADLFAPTTANRTQIHFGDATLPIVYASPSQITALTPSTLPRGAAPKLSVTNDLATAPYPDFVQVVEATPALFTAGSTGSGQAASLNQDGSANAAANPITRGQIVQLFGTGFGKLDTPYADGSLATPPYPKLTLPVTVQVGGKPAIIEYAGPAPGLLLGIVQINIRIPADAPTGPSVPLTIQAGSTVAEQSVTIAVK